MNKSLIKILFLLIFLGFSSDPARGAYSYYACGKFLEAVDLTESAAQMVRDVIDSDSKDLSVTGNRKELKFTVVEDQWISVKSFLERGAGPLKLRDIVKVGTRNLTRTFYLGKMEWAMPVRDGVSAKTSGKIRIREYLVEDLNNKLQTPSEITADHVFLEYKVEHWDRNNKEVVKNVVDKPRILISRTDLDYLLNTDLYERNSKKFRRGLETIKARAAGSVMKNGRGLFQNPPILVNAFIESLWELHRSGALSEMKKNKPLYTIYERMAYSVILSSQDRSSQLEIQVTVDQDIRHYEPEMRGQLGSYSPKERVVEVKIPLAYAGFTAENLKQFPQLVVIQRALSQLDSGHLDDYKKHAGKTHVFSGPDGD